MTEEKIKNSIIELTQKFNEINKLGYVKGTKPKSKGNVGLTFENLLGKENDCFQLADYDGIEIKAKCHYCSRYIALFSLVPSNCFGIELKRLRNNYGTPDENFKNINIFTKSVFANKKSYLKSGYALKLSIKQDEERIYLNVYDKSNNLIDNKIYWDFDDIISAINRKLKNLAIVKAKRKVMNKCEYFLFESIMFYKFKTIDAFFKFLKEGYIRIYFCLSVYKSGPKIGKEHDHGVIFGIKECDLLKLYDEYSI